MVDRSDPDHERTSVERREYDWTETNPTTAVAETLAAAADCDPLDLDPLYDSVDPDSLDTIVESSRPAADGCGTMVSFPLETRRVTVHGDGEVVVRDRD